MVFWKLSLLKGDDLLDGLPLFGELGVSLLVLLDHRVHQVLQKGPLDAQQPAVAGGPAQQPPQHVAPALVGGQHAVADHEHGGADVVGDHPEGHVALLVLPVAHPGDLHDLLHDVLHRVHQEQVVHPLHDASQALQSHAGVDVLLLELAVVPLAVVVKLGEHQVPDLHIPVAVAAHAAGGLAAAVLLPPVEVDLRAGAAGAGAVLPEVVLLAQALHVALRHADLFRPDVPGLVVVLVDGDVQKLLRHLEHLGEELPGPGDGLLRLK